MQTSIIFTETVELLNKKQRRIVHQGGAASGKTVNILAAIALYLSQNGGKIATVTSMSFPHLRAGALRDFETFIYPGFADCIRVYHKSNHIFYFFNGSVLEFKTYETEFDARGAKRDILFINEANTFDYMTYFQLDKRTNVTSILDYNPTIRFWCHDKVIGEIGTSLRISDHRHNPFLSSDKHEELESLKDPELWKVYARGLTGNVTGLIYPNWRVIDKFPDIDFAFAIDFGYTNDPTALIRFGKDGNDMYVDEVAYTTGNFPPKSIAASLKLNGYNENTLLFAEHDPDMIRQLIGLGVKVIPARKQAGSLNAGIEKIKEFNMYYTQRSRNIKKELSLYIWETDALGNPTNTPTDANNHALDAIRYGIYTHFYRKAA